VSYQVVTFGPTDLADGDTSGTENLEPIQITSPGLQVIGGHGLSTLNTDLPGQKLRVIVNTVVVRSGKVGRSTQSSSGPHRKSSRRDGGVDADRRRVVRSG
jgi:hypothetical protein